MGGCAQATHSHNPPQVIVELLCRQIQAHASSCSGSGVAGGSIRQSFCAALQSELAEFYHLMAVLQEQSLREGPKADALVAGMLSIVIVMMIIF